MKNLKQYAVVKTSLDNETFELIKVSDWSLFTDEEKSDTEQKEIAKCKKDGYLVQVIWRDF